MSETVKKELTKVKPKVVAPILVYAGPSIPSVVATNTIFNHGLTKELMDICETFPYIKNLIVPVENLAAIRMEINQKDSPANVCYSKLFNYIEKGE